MPIYEYSCDSCKNVTSIFLKNISSKADPICSSCNGSNLKRIISGFAYHRSIQTRMEESGPPQLNPSDDYYKDPTNIGRWAEKRLGELGVDMPEQAKEMIDAARDGEMPSAIKDI